MIGHERIEGLRQVGVLQAITIVVGTAQPYMSRMVQSGKELRFLPRPVEIVDREHPTVWTEKTEPGPLDLRWLFGTTVFVLQDDGEYPLFLRWLKAVSEHQPKFLATVADGELVTWPE